MKLLVKSSLWTPWPWWCGKFPFPGSSPWTTFMKSSCQPDIVLAERSRDALDFGFEETGFAYWGLNLDGQ